MKTKNVEEELYLASEIETTEQDTLSTASTAEETVSLYCASGSGSDCENCESNSNTWQTAYTLTLSEWMSESIITETDEIWFKFATNSSVHTNGGTALYTIQTRGGVDTDGELYADPEGEPLVYKDDGGSGYNFLIQEELSYNRTYYVRVMSILDSVGDFEICVTATAINTDSGSGSGSGSSSGSDCGSDCESSSANTMETAYELPLSTWMSGSIVNETDAVWYKFTTNSGTSLYTIQTRGSLDTDGRLYNSEKQQLAFDDDGGTDTNFSILQELNYRTTYYVEVMSNGPNTGDFEVCVEPYSSDSSGSGSGSESSSDGSSCCTMENAANLSWRKVADGYFSDSRSEYWFKLTADEANAHYNEQTGDYWIDIFPDVPVRGALYYSDGSLIKYDESDDTLGNYHFSLKQTMEWGEVCYLQLKALEEGTAYFFVIGDYEDKEPIPETTEYERREQEEAARNAAEAAKVADPVDVCSGSYTAKNTLMNLFGGQNLTLTASYSSSQHDAGVLGQGWSHNYEKRLAEQEDGNIYLYENPGVYNIYQKKSETAFSCTTLGKIGYSLTKTEDGYSLDCNKQQTEYYDADGYLTKIVSRQGFETIIAYTDTRQTVTDASTGKSMYLDKDENGRVVRVTDDGGRTAVLTYTQESLTCICDVNNNCLKYHYDDKGRLISGFDGNDVKFFTNIYDDYDRVIHQSDATDGCGTFFTYNGYLRVVKNRNQDTSHRVFNEQGLLISHTDENWCIKEYTYDSRGNMTGETDGLGNTKTTVYNLRNQPTMVTDKNGNITGFSYDTAGNLLKITHPNGSAETFAYNDRNQVVRHTDLRGTVTLYTYDVNGMPATKKVGERNAIQYVYENGLLMRETDAMGNTAVYEYNTLGQMVGKTDAAGNKTTYEYDLFGHLLKVTDANGNSITYEYDCNYQKISQTDANGNITRCSYNGNMKLTAMTLPDCNVVQQEYDAEDRVIKVIDQAGNATVTAYDRGGRITSRQDAEGNVVEYWYDQADRIIREINQKGASTVKTYDANGNVLSVTDGEGNITRYQYDKMGRMIRAVNAFSGTTLYEYSPAGDLLAETDPFGNRKTYSYDAYGNLLSVTDFNGNTTSYTYDANGNRTSVTDPLGNTTLMVYDVRNRLAEVTDAKCHTVSFCYDALGRRIQTMDARGNSTYTNYDANGNVISVVDAKCNPVSTTVYNELNLPIQVTNGAGQTTSYSYNALGKVSEITDALNHKQQYEYNARGQVIKVTDALNGESTASYDAMGQVTSMEGPLGGGTAYTYDDMGRVISQSIAANQSVQYGYNELNLREQLTNARGQVRKFFYDAKGRITGMVSEEDSVSYTYDANGNILTVTDSNGVITRTYDALNRVASVTDTEGNTIGYTYDAVGNLTCLTYPDGDKVHYTYDANNNLLTVTDWGNRVTTYTYDENNKVIGVVKPDESTTVTYYDDAQRVISTVERTVSGEIITGFEFQYDDLGRMVMEKDLAKNIQMCYTYDDLSRVIKRTMLNLADSSSSEETFAYDAAGNLIGDHEANVFEYDSDNRLYSFNYCPVSYDADGNTTYAYLDSKTNQFEYDSANRLIKAGAYAYTYNAEDVRIRSTYGTEITSYVYDTNAKLSRLLMKETYGTVTKYVYGLGLIGEIRTGAFKTYHFDYRGSTVAVTSECGTEMATFTYDTYGKLLSRTGRFKPIFLYNGRDGVVTDPNGLLYMRARYYSPELRRFMNADLLAGDISDARTLNRYSYVCGDPVSFVDPFGLEAERGTLGPTALEAAYMAEHIYTTTGTLIGDWVFIGLLPTTSPYEYENVFMGLYKRDTNGVLEYAIVNRGTTDWGSSDLYNNVTQPFGESPDMKVSIQVAKEFVKNNPDAHITFIGHSKGGAEALANAVATNKNAIVFNPAPVNLKANGLNANNYTAQSTAYIVEGEIVDETASFLSDSIATTVYLPSPTSKIEPKHFNSPFVPIDESVNRHSMDIVLKAVENHHFGGKLYR